MTRAPALCGGQTEPFGSAEEAVAWTMQALEARRAGARIRAGAGKVQRPCEPDDLVRLLDRLYRQRRITLDQVKVLRRYGERGRAPDPRAPHEGRDLVAWRDAVQALEPALRAKGLLAPRLEKTEAAA